MSQEQIEKAIEEFVENPDRPKMYMDNKLSVAKWGKALAEHLAAVLPPTFDEVVEAAREACRSNYIEITIDSVSSGHVRGLEPKAAKGVNWPGSDDIGQAIMAAIKSAMKPEPTAKEKALAALRDIEEAPCSLGPRIAIIREALEAE